MSATTKTYTRFGIARRLEHAVLILSFTTLCLTGLPQKYVGQAWAETAIKVMGGVELVRVVHHTAAVLFILETIYHLAVLGYMVFVQRAGMTMLPGLKDIKDGLQAFGYNLGLSKKRPQMGRYSFDEKMEYWAMIWGLVVMVLTGLMLWNPVAVTKYLPGQFIPAAKAAHGAEALLAFLGILVWHIYHVHLRHFNKSMFTGKLTQEEMLHEHPLELVEIEGKPVPQPVPPTVVEKRRRVYLPVAGVLSLALLAGVIYLVTFEKTAIPTVPPAETAVAFSPQTPTPAPTPEGPKAVALPAEGALTWDASVGALFESKCGACHGTSGGLGLKTYADALKGAESGPVIVAGSPDTSPLVSLQSSGKHPGLFAAEELQMVKDWIAAGAPEK